MRRFYGFLGLAAAAVALSGCVGDRISHNKLEHYDSSHLGDAAKYGPIPVRVYGQPMSGATELATASAIAEAMTGANIGTPTTYVATEQLPASGYAMIVQFGGGVPAGRLCSEGGDSGVGANYAAAFCLNETSLSSLAGAVGDANIASASFRQSMSTAAVVMLPTENPNYGLCDDGAGCN